MSYMPQLATSFSEQRATLLMTMQPKSAAMACSAEDPAALAFSSTGDLYPAAMLLTDVVHDDVEARYILQQSLRRAEALARWRGLL